MTIVVEQGQVVRDSLRMQGLRKQAGEPQAPASLPRPGSCMVSMRRLELDWPTLRGKTVLHILGDRDE